MVLFIISFFISFIIGVINYDKSHIHTSVYHLKTKKINKSLRICLLADLHGAVFENDLLFKRIVEAKPDIIIMAGDMANAKVNFNDESAIQLIKKLSIKYPVYYAIGNHEARLKANSKKYGISFEKYCYLIEKNGAVVLDNNSIHLNNFNIDITGLTLTEDYFKKIRLKETGANFVKGFLKEKSDCYEILIAHNPEYFKTYLLRKSDLILSGHLHGGIIRLPFNRGAISPRYVLLPKYAAGLFREADSRMIVSRGLGQHTIPVRVFNTAELVVVNIDKI